MHACMYMYTHTNHTYDTYSCTYAHTYDVLIFTIYRSIYRSIDLSIDLSIDRSIYIHAYSARCIHTGPTTRPRPFRVCGKHRRLFRPPPSSIHCGDLPLAVNPSGNTCLCPYPHISRPSWFLSGWLCICLWMYLSDNRPTSIRLPAYL